MTTRLSISTLAGRSRTVVAVGMDREASMFVATALAMPLRTVAFSCFSSAVVAVVVSAGSEGTAWAAGVFLGLGPVLTEVSLGCAPRAGAVAAFGSVTLAEAFGSVLVAAFGSVLVAAFGSAVVEAFGSAVVEAFGSAVVAAFGSVSAAGALASRRAKICAHCRSTEPESSRYFR